MTNSIKEEKLKTLKEEVEKAINKIPLRYRYAKEEIAKSYEIGESYYIFGGVGTGKTHLAYAILKKDIQRQLDWANKKIEEKPDENTHYSIRPLVMVANFPSMLQDIRDSIKDNTISDTDFYKTYEGTLIIDDLGVEKFSEWVIETLYIIINKRYENELPTIIISNLSLKELSEKVGDRITSRIAEMCEIKKVEGEDKRLSKEI